MEIYGLVGIRTSLSLDELARVISEQLAGGIEFGGRDDEGLRDEVPAKCTQRDFLGLRLILYGADGDYGLDVEQWNDEVPDVEVRLVDLSNYLLFLLKRINGLQPHLGLEEEC